MCLFSYLNLGKIERKNCAQEQEACEARLFVLQNIFTIQREDSSHAVFFHFGNVSTFRKYGFLRSCMQRRSPSPLSGKPQGERSPPTRYATKKFGYPQNGESPAHLFFCVSKIFSYFGMIYNPEILVYNVSEIKNMMSGSKGNIAKMSYNMWWTM